MDAYLVAMFVFLLLCEAFLLAGGYEFIGSLSSRKHSPTKPAKAETVYSTVTLADVLLARWNEFPTTAQKNEWFDTLPEAEQVLLHLKLREELEKFG